MDGLLGRDFTKTNPVQVYPVPKKLIKLHYENIKGKPFYDLTVKSFSKSIEGIILRVYEGDNIVDRMRVSVGHTDSKKAEQGTIRQIFSNDSLDIAFSEKRYLNNVIHASKNVEDAIRELELWKEYLIYENI